MCLAILTSCQVLRIPILKYKLRSKRYFVKALWQSERFVEQDIWIFILRQDRLKNLNKLLLYNLH